MTIPSATDLTGVPQLEKKSIPLCVPDLYERGALGSLEARVGKFKESIGRINFSDGIILSKDGGRGLVLKR